MMQPTLNSNLLTIKTETNITIEAIKKNEYYQKLKRIHIILSKYNQIFLKLRDEDLKTHTVSIDLIKQYIESISIQIDPNKIKIVNKNWQLIFDQYKQYDNFNISYLLNFCNRDLIFINYIIDHFFDITKDFSNNLSETYKNIKIASNQAKKMFLNIDSIFLMVSFAILKQNFFIIDGISQILYLCGVSESLIKEIFNNPEDINYKYIILNKQKNMMNYSYINIIKNSLQQNNNTQDISENIDIDDSSSNLCCIGCDIPPLAIFLELMLNKLKILDSINFINNIKSILETLSNITCINSNYFNNYVLNAVSIMFILYFNFRIIMYNNVLAYDIFLYALDDDYLNTKFDMYQEYKPKILQLTKKLRNETKQNKILILEMLKSLDHLYRNVNNIFQTLKQKYIKTIDKNIEYIINVINSYLYINHPYNYFLKLFIDLVKTSKENNLDIFSNQNYGYFISFPKIQLMTLSKNIYIILNKQRLKEQNPQKNQFDNNKDVLEPQIRKKIKINSDY